MSLDLRHLYAAYADESWEAERDADLHRAIGRGKFSPWERDIERLVVRNDQLRRLMATAKVIGWCEEHSSPATESGCGYAKAYWNEHFQPCRIVSKFLVDPITSRRDASGFCAGQRPGELLEEGT